MGGDPLRGALDFADLADRSAPARTALIPVDRRTVRGTAEIDEVIAQLAEAAQTLLRIRMRGGRPAGLKAGWPDVVRNAFEAFNAEAPDKTEVRRAAPSPQQITRMDEAIGWLLWVEQGSAIIVWARAMRIRWRKLEHRLALSESTLRDRWRIAIVTIAAERIRRGG